MTEHPSTTRVATSATVSTTSSATTRTDDVPSPVPTPMAETRSYGPDDAQVYDAIPPSAGVTPVDATVVIVHGGFWRADYDRTHAQGQALGFVDAGFHVALGEYRRTGMPGGGVPGTLHDVRDLVAAVRADPALPDRVVLVGHSAGGHLVAWAANQPWAQGLAGVVCLAAVVDLRQADGMQLGGGAVRAFVGAPPADTRRWDLADPMSSLPPRVPVRLIFGRDDDVVPVAVSDGYVRQTRTAGADVTLEVLDATSHFSVIQPGHPSFVRTVEVVRSLLR